MKRILRQAIKPFLPKYQVIFTSYQIIPGQPITKKLSKHAFEKGASKEAKEFYNKVIGSEFTKALAPVEVHLKRSFFTVSKTNFGPVEKFKKVKDISAH
ncbi:hypothetical protein GU926_16335 [Nibribacter ruber]|uniref:Uncharacterized protein n=1 Tax=Nibribacter ruber TaxID=2698458 RepID=A0A6P1P3G1_9BACT|nr:hypothetical protein [Nibribacter ruber]QHL88911.1 hypothetical protein GU926_16335 [Nibribacter ruber]